MTNLKLSAKAAGYLSRFEQAGAQVIEADILQPADTLLDLYGEDIRARAFVTNDPLNGEMMLRPDFTVPVAQMHMAGDGGAARYAYAGKVFRQQEHRLGRPTEYLQVGYELFDAPDAAQADAEVFVLMSQTLSELPVQPVIGDIGILLAAVNGLNTFDRRKSALTRHIWRPMRFKSLLDRFTGRRSAAAHRAALGGTTVADIEAEGPIIGLRTVAEVQDRIGYIAQDGAAATISEAEADVIDRLLVLRETAPNAIEQLRDMAVDLPSMIDAIDLLEARLEALSGAGIDVENLAFEASYGRTIMEYYDGFVFGFYPTGRPDQPPVATGGRYDALTAVLGQGRSCPAVGGVIRPDRILQLEQEGAR